ncbi:MAG: hypothetical protein IK071_07730, partial [Lachnospiraceae bacterium]|nr:hypothetical protein [Lachnospiraceae bacterium]
MKRVSKVLSLLLALVLIVSATGTIPAKADNTLLMAVESQPYFLVVPGQTTHVTIPVKVAGGHDV